MFEDNPPHQEPGGFTGQFDLRPVWGFVADITTQLSVDPDGTYHFADCHHFKAADHTMKRFVHLMEDPKTVTEPKYTPCQGCAAERVDRFWAREYRIEENRQKALRGEWTDKSAPYDR